MRGLRRGIGLYINEVSSPSYRREVQRLASKGKLAVVVSDDSLAFGVNMPFRTCVFAGEMGGELTPLMAQQMSGRAGRRGLDTQGMFVECLSYITHCSYTLLYKQSVYRIVCLFISLSFNYLFVPLPFLPYSCRILKYSHSICTIMILIFFSYYIIPLCTPY